MSIAGKTKVAIQAESFARRQNLLALIEQHGPVESKKLHELTGYSKPVIFAWLRGMGEDGHVVREKTIDANGHICNCLTRGQNIGPLPMFELGGGHYLGTSAPKVRQEVVKAKQIGMPPYGDLPRAFFGQVGA